MPVKVDVSLKPSRARWLYASLMVALQIVFLILIGLIFLWVVPLLFYLMFAWVWGRELDAEFVIFDGDSFVLQNSAHRARWFWRGHCVRSHAFISLTLYSDNGTKNTLRIWRDSVSDAQWRALNMALRVNQNTAQQSH